MAIKQTWDLHVTHLLLTTIDDYDFFRDEVIDRLMWTFDGEDTGGAFEAVHINCKNPECSNGADPQTREGLLNVADASRHEAQGRTLDYQFEDKQNAIEAAEALQELGAVIGVFIHWVKEDDQYPEGDERRYEFADELEYDWSRFEGEDIGPEGALN